MQGEGQKPIKQNSSKFSFLSKEDNFSIAKYYSNFSESQNKKKIFNEKEIAENKVLLNIKNTSIECFIQMSKIYFAIINIILLGVAY